MDLSVRLDRKTFGQSPSLVVEDSPALLFVAAVETTISVVLEIATASVQVSVVSLGPKASNWSLMDLIFLEPGRSTKREKLDPLVA